MVILPIIGKIVTNIEFSYSKIPVIEIRVKGRCNCENVHLFIGDEMYVNFDLQHWDLKKVDFGFFPLFFIFNASLPVFFDF